MNLKRFRKISKISSILLILAAVFLFIIFLFIGYQVLVLKSDMWRFNYSPGFTLFNSVSTSGNFQSLDTILSSAASVVTPIEVFISIIALWKGSQLFNQLSKGERPFTNEFSRSIKRIGLLLILSDVILPVLYSLIVTLQMAGEYYIIFGIGGSFLTGLILYAVSEVFYYGIELQNLSDETV